VVKMVAKLIRWVGGKNGEAVDDCSIGEGWVEWLWAAVRMTPLWLYYVPRGTDAPVSPLLDRGRLGVVDYSIGFGKWLASYWARQCERKKPPTPK
jgi:hypothetical protein